MKIRAIAIGSLIHFTLTMMSALALFYGLYSMLQAEENSGLMKLLSTFGLVTVLWIIAWAMYRLGNVFREGIVDNLLDHWNFEGCIHQLSRVVRWSSYNATFMPPTIAAFLMVIFDFSATLTLPAALAASALWMYGNTKLPANWLEDDGSNHH